MANPTPDFVQVQLTAAGLALAGKGALTISNGRRTYAFTGTAAQKVELRYEWRSWLSKVHDAKGNPLFEIAPAAPVEPAEPTATTAAPAAPAPVATAAPVTTAGPAAPVTTSGSAAPVTTTAKTS